MSLGKIDILVGQDDLWKFVVDEIVVHPSEEFGIIKPKLGWTLGGSICINSSTKWQRNKPENNLFNIIDVNNNKNKIEEALFKLFEAETETADETTYTPDQMYALEGFKRNIKVEEDGRYTVDPLFKENSKPLKNNYYRALARYKAVRKSLARDKTKKEIYTQAVQEMIKNGEIEKVIEPPNRSENMDLFMNYLPHHGVIKMDRLTTKCRIVFDGSCKNYEG